MPESTGCDVTQHVLVQMLNVGNLGALVLLQSSIVLCCIEFRTCLAARILVSVVRNGLTDMQICQPDPSCLA